MICSVKTYSILEDKDVVSIRKQMLDLGIYSQTELAKKLNVSKAYINAVLRGKKHLTIKFKEKLESVGIKL